MTKVKVQDATRQLSTNAGELFESVSRARKQAQDAFGALKKISDDLNRAEKQRLDMEAKEALRKQYEAAATYMTGYSTEQVSEIQEAASRVEKERARAAEEAAKAAEAAARAAEAAKAAETEARPQGQYNRPQGDRPQGQYNRPQGDRPQGQYNRPQGDRPQGQYNRPQGDRPQGQFNRPQGDRPQGQYNRPQGDRPQGQFNRPQGDRPQGQFNRPQGDRPQGQFNRPQGDRPQGQFNRPQGDRPQGQFNRPQGDRPQGDRPQGQYNRPQGDRPQGGFGGGSRPAAGARNSAPRASKIDLTPTVEKERVSNYDPNKKQYVRQNDPERTKNRRVQTRGGYESDDEVVRGGKRKKKVQQEVYKPEPIKIEKAYMTAETITVKDLSERISKPVGEIIKKLLLLGIMASINNELDYDTAQLICSEFDVELELKLAETAEDALEAEDTEDVEEDLEKRAPVVTIMGHVDHGKTSLLDYIRKSRVTAGEAGGITQHIGAYTVNVNDESITFLDTPGHEAFTAMRARGAQVTDIAILVVAADDGVMPQTVEAINHAKAANVPTIVAINKIDKPVANPERIKQELTEYNLVAEEWGGDTIMVPVSALTGEGVDNLLEMVLLVAEMQNLRANPNRKARGAIIEAQLDKGRGPVATVLIKNGTLQIGDMIIAGTAYGRVRAMVNDRGERVKTAGPSDPVEVIGFNDVPSAGDIFSAVNDDRLSRQVAEERKDKLRAALIKNSSKASLDDLFSQISSGQTKELNIIIKADVQGSVEAVRQSLEKLSNEEVRVRAIHGGVGAITESDIMLASASNAIIIGFNVRHDNTVRDIADREKVDIRLYRVIYNAIEDVQAAMKGMLAPQYKETILGRAQVRMTFKVSGAGTIAGSYVTDGKIVRNATARLLRDNVVITEAKIDSLKRFKDDAREVATGFECGIGLERFNDVKEGDVIECFTMEEIAR